MLRIRNPALKSAMQKEYETKNIFKQSKDIKSDNFFIAELEER